MMTHGRLQHNACLSDVMPKLIPDMHLVFRNSKGNKFCFIPLIKHLYAYASQMDWAELFQNGKALGVAFRLQDHLSCIKYKMLIIHAEIFKNQS